VQPKRIRKATRANRIYIEFFTWPHSTFHLDRVPRNVTGAFLLADGSKKRLKVAKSASGVDIELPSHASDPIATVVVLETE
jgi:alpha-L-fucosidase